MGYSIRKVNLEAGFPTTAESEDSLRKEIKYCKNSKIGCMLIIHGYGSSGTGGSICIRVRNVLKMMKNSGTVKDFIFGEDFTIFNEKARKLKLMYPELESLTKVCNNGVTVVEL